MSRRKENNYFLLATGNNRNRIDFMSKIPISTYTKLDIVPLFHHDYHFWSNTRAKWEIHRPSTKTSIQRLFVFFYQERADNNHGPVFDQKNDAKNVVLLNAN